MCKFLVLRSEELDLSLTFVVAVVVNGFIVGKFGLFASPPPPSPYADMAGIGHALL